MSIGVAIPTYERPAMTFEVCADVYNDPRIEEIVIVDDNSSGPTVSSLVETARKHFKVRLKTYETHVGCYNNKYRAILHAAMPWVALIDSDNKLTPEYLDALDSVRPWRPDTLYLPVLTQPRLTYTAFAGLKLTSDNIRQYLHDDMLPVALNTGNFFVSREAYLDVFDVETDPVAADSLYFTYCWLTAGGTLRFVPGMSYWHRVHDGYWTQNRDASDRFAEKVIARILSNRWDVPLRVNA